MKTDEQRIPITAATARNLIALSRSMDDARQALDGVTGRMQDHVRMLYTEHGIEEGRVLEVTETAPHEVVVVVTKRTKED
jgi:hypothetical protein